MQYWLTVLGQRFGPYSASQLRHLMDQGQVPQGATIWDPAQEQWVAPSAIITKPLKPTLASMPPPTTPPHSIPAPASSAHTSNSRSSAPTVAGWYPNLTAPGHWVYWTGTHWSKTPAAGLAGWFTEPSDFSMQRYWDGVGWTDHRRPAGQASKSGSNVGVQVFFGVLAALAVVVVIAFFLQGKAENDRYGDIVDQELCSRLMNPPPDCR